MSTTAAFPTDPSQVWQVFATPSDRDAARISVGAHWQATPFATVFGNVNAEEGTSTHNFGFRAGVQWRW